MKSLQMDDGIPACPLPSARQPDSLSAHFRGDRPARAAQADLKVPLPSVTRSSRCPLPQNAGELQFSETRLPQHDPCSSRRPRGKYPRVRRIRQRGLLSPMQLALGAGSPAVGRALRCETKGASSRRAPLGRFGPFMRTRSRRCRNPRNRRERARRAGTRQV